MGILSNIQLHEFPNDFRHSCESRRLYWIKIGTILWAMDVRIMGTGTSTCMYSVICHADYYVTVYVRL